MNAEDRKRYGMYIVAQLRRTGILDEIFHTHEPTEDALKKEIAKRKSEEQIKKMVVPKSIYKLLRKETKEPTEYTLNDTAELFNVEPCDIDAFCKAWREGAIKESDLYFDENKEPDIQGDHTKIIQYIKTYPDIENRVLPQFVGRKFVFDKVNEFIDSKKCGYFRIIGDPGIGKTSLAIKYAKENDCFLHIVNADKDSTGTAKKFLQNICAQIITKQKLFEFKSLPEDIDKDGSFIKKVLQTASVNLNTSEKIVIVVDGLDEVNDLTFYKGKNILQLPRFLPSGIFFILTMRNIEDQIQLPNEEENERFEIRSKSDENIADTEEYINNEVEQEGIQKYLRKHSISKEDFIETLKEKSEGNFMYLKYVIPEIAKGNYKDVILNKLPQGLEEYYKDHWNRMLEGATDIEKEVKLKTIYVLSDMRNPVSVDYLTNIINTNIEGIDKYKVQEVLDEWKQFLNIKEDGEKYKYSFYHKSFLDFLKNKEIIKAAGFNYDDVNEIILDYMTKGLLK